MSVLKILRVVVATTVFTLLTLFFFGLVEGCGALIELQVGPALIGCSAVTLVGWLLATLFAGRLFCSFACPLGILQDLLGRLARPLGRKSFAFRPGHPLVQVVSCCAFLLAGTAISALLDPYSVFGRIVSSIHGRTLSGLVLAGSSLVLLFLVVAWKGRLVCDSICPIGAALAALSQKSVLGIRLNAVKCVECGTCTRVCKARCLDGRRGVVDQARCVRCFNCLGACEKGAISYGFKLKSLTPPKVSDAGLQRRTTLVGLGAAIASFAFGTKIGQLEPKATPPPGTLARLRANCTACGLCIAKCPQRILVPAGLNDYGPLGFFLPKRDLSRGDCPPDCSVCAQVCPTKAIYVPTDVAETK